MKEKPTLRSIAEELGLSVSSVSLVLNHRENRISPENRRRIFEAAERVGYLPSGKRKSRQKPVILGLIVPELSNAFFADIVQGMTDCAYKQEAKVLLATNGESPSRDAEQIRSMAATGVSAMIVALSYNCSPDVFAGMSCPVIQVDRQSPSLPYSSIRLNNRKGGYLAARHLIELGHRRVACITGPRWLMSSQERESGYRWAMEEAGISVTGDMVIEGDYLSTGGYALADSVIAGGFTAVFCENDMTAIGLYRRFRERGITVGQDISVVGFDDISFCEMLDTPLTTIRQSGYDIGYEACSRAMQEIANPELPHQSIYFEPRLIKRESARARRKGSTL